MFRKLYLSQYLMDSTNEGSKFKLDCEESKNMLLINVINFKLRLINFVYIFETPGIPSKAVIIWQKNRKNINQNYHTFF